MGEKEGNWLRYSVLRRKKNANYNSRVFTAAYGNRRRAAECAASPVDEKKKQKTARYVLHFGINWFSSFFFDKA